MRPLVMLALALAGCARGAAVAPDAAVATTPADAAQAREVDAAVDGDAPDTSPVDAAPPPFCVPSFLLGAPLCLARAPSAPVQLAADIDTARDCAARVPQQGGPALCVIAGTSITLHAGSTVHAHGANAIVLVATDITIDGALDLRPASGGVPPAPGARHPDACGPTDGPSGLIVDAFSPTFNRAGGGGGAGGSGRGGTTSVGDPSVFGGAGGIGGNGIGLINRGRGVPISAPVAAGLLVGGCDGGAGAALQEGPNIGDGAARGGGGGAVYLLALRSVSVSGSIDASGGAGSDGGTYAVDGNGGGGGGGGAGGTVAIEAPTTTIAGALIINGGAGGRGGDSPPWGGESPGFNGGTGGVGARPGVAPDQGVNGGGIDGSGSGLPGSGGGGGGGWMGTVQLIQPGGAP